MAASSEETFTPSEKQTQTDTTPCDTHLESSDTMEKSGDDPSEVRNTVGSRTDVPQVARTDGCVEREEQSKVSVGIATDEAISQAALPVITNDMYRNVVNERDKLYNEIQVSKEQVCIYCVYYCVFYVLL